VVVVSASHAVPATADSLTAQSNAAGQTVEVDTTGRLDVDLQVATHLTTPNPGDFLSQIHGEMYPADWFLFGSYSGC
jgi:hypothetical protein